MASEIQASEYVFTCTIYRYGGTSVGPIVAYGSLAGIVEHLRKAYPSFHYNGNTEFDNGTCRVGEEGANHVAYIVSRLNLIT